MSRTELSFMRSYDPGWRMRRGRRNLYTDKEILEALRTSKTLEEARYKLGVSRSTINKYLRQLKSKGLVGQDNKVIEK